MKLTIDNLDGRGAQDYTPALDGERAPRVARRLNRPAELRCSVVASTASFAVPANGARVTLARANGTNIFTGYLAAAEVEYLGWGERGPAYRYNLVARSDELLLEQKTLPGAPAFVGRSAGDALRRMTETLLPGGFDTSAVADLDVLPSYTADPQKRWAEHAAEIALRARASYRAMGGALALEAAGATTHTLDESANDFSPEGLTLTPVERLVNDVTVIGRLEPQAHVKDYLVGDGLSWKFYLSQIPFTRRSRTLVEEEYATLDAARWTVSDPAAAVSVSGGKLQMGGGTGVDGVTTVRFAEKMELGGVIVLQHGDVAFSAASDGVLGGLYGGGVAVAGCLAGFRITPANSASRIQALVNGAATGPAITTQAGHRYALTTRLYATEIYRRQQTFHSSAHPAGNGRGGAAVAADVRVVLEVHDIDPANPGSLVAPSTVLYDGVLAGAPDYCSYALVNAANLHCTIAFTRILRAVDAMVRSALPLQSYRTRLAGSLAEGAECRVTEEPALLFFPQYVPAANELIEVSYRGRGRARARVTDPVSVQAQRRGSDDGVRGAVRAVKAPAPRTSADCENAGLALLDDATQAAWRGEYQTWSDFLPGNAGDVFPGDAVQVNVPSRGARFQAIVREVEIEAADVAGERSRYAIRFANDAAEPLGFEFESAAADPLDAAVVAAAAGTTFLPDLTAAEVTQVTSTSISIDAGVTPPVGGGIEVRRSDWGWGQENDRNLAGRFTTRTFTVPRLGRLQDYFARQYDASAPAKYSRYSAALHVDYPL